MQPKKNRNTGPLRFPPNEGAQMANGKETIVLARDTAAGYILKQSKNGWQKERVYSTDDDGRLVTCMEMMLKREKIYASDGTENGIRIPKKCRINRGREQ
jgi:hypothetical protein